MHRRYQALIIAGVLGGVSQQILPLALLSCAIVSLFLLRRSEKQGLFILGGTAAITFFVGITLQTRPGLEIPVTLLLLLPVYICSRILRQTGSQGNAVAAAGICAALFAVGIQLFSGDAVAWWSAWLKSASYGVQGITYESLENYGIILIMNGLVAMVLALMTIGSVMLARWMQAKLYNPGAFKKEFQALQIPQKVTFNLVAVLLILILFKHLLYDLLVIAAGIYALQGLAILHYTSNKNGYSVFSVLPPYILMLVIPQFVIVGLACLGVTDIFLNYRKLS